MPDRLAVPVDDDVALVDARRGSWSSRVDIHHHGARSPALGGHEPEAEAEIAARDAPVPTAPDQEVRFREAERIQLIRISTAINPTTPATATANHKTVSITSNYP
jgi:hypothetical protein